MPDLNAILNDDKTYPDNLEIILSPGDGRASEKIALGTIRDMSRRQQQELTTRLAETKSEFDKARELSTQAATMLASLQKEPPKQDERRAEPPSDYDKLYDTDPYYEPIRKRLSPLEKVLEEIRKGQEDDRKAREQMVVAFARDRFDRQYRDVKERLKDDKYKDYRDPQKLAQYAVSKGLTDEFGLPSVEKAVSDLTREDDLERIRKEAYEEGRKKGAIDNRMRSMQRGTTSGGGGEHKDAADITLNPEMNFNDLDEKVLGDPDGRKVLAELAELGVQIN